MLGVRALAEIQIRGKDYCILDMDGERFVTDGFKIEPLLNKDRAYMTLIRGSDRLPVVQRCLANMNKRNCEYVFFVIPDKVLEAMKRRINMLTIA